MATCDDTRDPKLDMDKGAYFCDSPQGWIMQQILLDNMALGEGIPLRVIRLEALTALHQNFSAAAVALVKEAEEITARIAKEDSAKKEEVEAATKAVNDAKELKGEFDKFFSDEDHNEDHFKDFVNSFLENMLNRKNGEVSKRLDVLNKLYNELANNIFPVLPSNLHSLEFLSQTIVNCWRIYALLWLYKKLVLDDKAPHAENQIISLEQIYGLDNFSAICRLVRIKKNNDEDGDDQVLLFAGPIFEVEIEDLTNETGVDTAVTDKVPLLLNALHKLTSEKSDGTDDSGNHFRQAIHLETVRQPGFLAERFDNVLEIWHLLKNATLGENTKISHKYLRMLTLWAQHVNNLTERHKPKSEHLTIENVVVTSDRLYGEPERKTYLSAMKERDSWRLAMEEAKAKANDDAGDVPTTSEQGARFYDLYTRLERKTKQLDKNRLIVMNLWLESHFSALLHSSQKAAPDRSDVVARLAAWICAALRADIAEVHSYHPEQKNQPLKIHDMYIREKKYHGYRKKTIEGLEKLLLGKREISNIYQALLTGRERICLDRELASKFGNGAHEALCKIEVTLEDMYTEWPPESAEMVVPINFNGRVIGSTRVVSLGRWRFRWGQRILLLNIATNLGAYWYQQRHLSCLSAIQRHVIDFNQNVDQDVGNKVKLYNAICNEAAVLFLCLGAGLWVRNNTNHDEFNLEGWHGFEIKDKSQRVEKGETFISYTVTEANKKKKEDAPFFSEHVESSSRIRLINKEALKAAGIVHVAHIPIRDKDDKVMAVLALYDSSTRGFGDSWRFIVQFFAGHLHVILDSVAAVIREREGRKQIIMHEISNSVSHLVDKAKKIATPISDQVVDRLNQVHSALSAPAVVERLEMAKFMGEIPKNLDVLTELGTITYTLSSRAPQPLSDIKSYTSKLEDQLYALSLGFAEGALAQLVEKTYKDNPGLISAVTKKVANLFAKTTDREFVAYLVANKFLGENSSPVNLYDVVNQVVKGVSATPYYIDAINRAIDINVDANVLQTVLDNLWKNAEKYRFKPSDLVSFTTEETPNGGCKLLIVNRTKTYREEERRQLTTKGYRRKSTPQDQRSNKSYNAGFGLYLVENLCKHVLHMGFEIRQENNRPDGSSDFVCELFFNPNFVIKKR